MSQTPENSVPHASTEQVVQWMAHDLHLLKNGAEIVDGNLRPTAEQVDGMRERMVAEQAGHLIGHETLAKTDKELMSDAAVQSLNGVMKHGFNASPDSVSAAFTKRSILPKDVEGDTAAEVAKIFSRKSRDRVSPDQMKWFALGLAVQANAASKLKESATSTKYQAK